MTLRLQSESQLEVGRPSQTPPRTVTQCQRQSRWHSAQAPSPGLPPSSFDFRVALPVGPSLSSVTVSLSSVTVTSHGIMSDLEPSYDG
jgi:hypothetical protein